MWIRSQSKKALSNVNQLIINNTKDESKYYIFGYSERGSDTLGVYSTEEKAIKVLDRIEELIQHQYKLTFCMPADDEVVTVKKRVDYAEFRMLEQKEKWWGANMTEKDLDEFEKEFGFKLLPTWFNKPLSEITKEEYRERIEYLYNAIINDDSNEEDDF